MVIYSVIHKRVFTPLRNLPTRIIELSTILRQRTSYDSKRKLERAQFMSNFNLKCTIFRNNHAQSFLVRVWKWKFCAISSQFTFCSKILTHASMGDCFFLYATPLPPKNQNVTWQEGKMYLYATYMWVGLCFLGGNAAIFTLMLNLGDLTSHRIAKTNLTWQVIRIARSEFKQFIRAMLIIIGRIFNKKNIVRRPMGLQVALLLFQDSVISLWAAFYTWIGNTW